MTELEMAKVALRNKAEIVADLTEELDHALKNASNLRLELGETKLVLESTEFKLKHEIKQGKVYRTETERFKAMRLCTTCVCKNYHEKGCECRVTKDAECDPYETR